MLDHYDRNTFLLVLVWKNVENVGKTAVFPGGYGQIGVILHGGMWTDWGLYG